MTCVLRVTLLVHIERSSRTYNSMKQQSPQVPSRRAVVVRRRSGIEPLCMQLLPSMKRSGRPNQHAQLFKRPRALYLNTTESFYSSMACNKPVSCSNAAVIIPTQRYSARYVPTRPQTTADAGFRGSHRPRSKSYDRRGDTLFHALYLARCAVFPSRMTTNRMHG